MHDWVSGRAGNPLEIELRPTNLSEEILASSHHTDMLQSQQSTDLDLSHCTLGLCWFNTKKWRSRENRNSSEFKLWTAEGKKKNSKHRASHKATKIKAPTKQVIFQKQQQNQAVHPISQQDLPNELLLLPLFYIYIFFKYLRLCIGSLVLLLQRSPGAAQ